uniref:CSON010221 protein n=1 Tax=Culicoides sonorensis TaxID=179676 RepID=A0A336KFN8_CULSO
MLRAVLTEIIDVSKMPKEALEGMNMLKSEDIADAVIYLLSTPNSSISPGVVETNLGITAGMSKDVVKTISGLKSKDISDAVLYLLGTPSTVNVTEITIRPSNANY